MTGRIFHVDGTAPGEVDGVETCFVFGSNLAAQHVGGAALAANRFFGAEPGIAEGFAGHSYAIPTCDNMLQPLKLDAIRPAVERFIQAANANPQKRFFVTRIGCGIAGHVDADIAPMFLNAPANCSFADEWAPFLSPSESVDHVN